MKTNKTITLGVCGGIAAYKSCELVRLLVKENFDVQVMMTLAAQKFVTPLTFQTLSKRPVATDMFSLIDEATIGHIKLADDPDLVLIAPATANIIAKTAHGICDDIVSTVLNATKAKIVMAPAMNVNMYQNPITQENIQKLKKLGMTIFDTEEGDLACGYQGQGRMMEPQNIVAKIKEILK